MARFRRIEAMASPLPCVSIWRFHGAVHCLPEEWEGKANQGSGGAVRRGHIHTSVRSTYASALGIGHQRSALRRQQPADLIYCA